MKLTSFLIIIYIILQFKTHYWFDLRNFYGQLTLLMNCYLSVDYHNAWKCNYSSIGLKRVTIQLLSHRSAIYCVAMRFSHHDRLQVGTSTFRKHLSETIYGTTKFEFHKYTSTKESSAFLEVVINTYYRSLHFDLK